eukprot:GFUD01043315.1.p1 GENE.GFUD01043315.1~~GFUD01043315.1.p1  ORF type:complete len:2211 (+),score=819.60 GFUD01043315.1:247-6879(+)
MENIDKNADILTILDGYKSYAAEYEERRKKEEQEEKMRSAEEEKKRVDAARKKSIQEEIADTLNKIRAQEAVDAKKFEEERQRRDEKKRRELEMKEKIQAELEKMQKLEEVQFAQIKQQQEIRDKDRREMEIQLREEQKKMEELEAKRISEKKKIEDIERKKLLAEIQAKKAKQKQEEAKKLVEEAEKRKAKEALAKKKRIEEEEHIRQKFVEEEKRRLWAEEREKERKVIDDERLAKFEDNRRVSAEIMARRQAEEEEMAQLKKDAEENRHREIELAKKAVLEEKKRSILSTFEKKDTENKTEPERPKRRSVANPFAQKFEEIALNAQKEEQEQQELLKKKKKKIRKSRDLFRRSKQLLTKVSKESLRKSQNILKKLSTDSLKKTSRENLNRSFTKLQKSLSRECLNGSKQGLYDKDKNLSSQNINFGKKQSDSHPANRQQMQNYLISQVLFDGKEDVKSSRMHMANKPSVIHEEEDTEKEEENKRKEIEMIKREMEMKKQIKAELNRIKALDEEQRIKQQEAHFESYKKEMEKYLDFVCEDTTESTSKKVKKKKKVVPEPSKKLTLNIGNIKSQFESVQNEKVSPAVKSAPPQIQKLNPIKLFTEQKEEEIKPRKKKEYVPVIIDKAAFERTVGMFEKERREEEEKKQNELRIRKRREEMESERQRLIQEKERIEREENEKLERERRERYEEEERQKLEDEANALANEESDETEAEESPPIPEKVDIFEQIKRELDKIKEEDEKMKEKIEKERKKKELMKQIQDEIDKIKTVDNTLQKPEDPEDDTPAWIKMIMGSKNKEKQDVKANKEKLTTKEPPATRCQTENIESDSEAPKWMKIFQERSDKLKAKKEKVKCDIPVNDPERENTDSLDNEKQINLSKNTEKSLKKSHTFANIETTANEALVQKSVSSVKHQFEKSNNEENVEVKKRTGTQKVTDRVRRVKSLLLEGGSSQEEKKEKTEKKITKLKANKIKNLFEAKTTVEELPEAPKRPKKKLVKLPGEEHKEPSQKKPVDRVWKWKQKDVSELYNFIDSNKSHLPDSLAKKAEKSFAKEPETKYETSKNKDLLMEDEEFENYLETIHKYVEEKDTDETESCFKDTIIAYLDLIDENPRKKVKTNKASKPKKTFSVNTAAMKDLLEGNNQSEALVTNKDINIRKLDTSFLFKENEDEKLNEKPIISQDNIRSMKVKYEVLGADEGPKELYSMKRKLIAAKPDVDSMSWKKQQVEHQWKYKQKGIEELQQFIKQNREKANTVKEVHQETREYVPYFQNMNFKSRVEDEDKKMEEFENFMDEIHDYLESETQDDEESSFKWGIHSYIDLIEENKGEVCVKYERKDPKALPENMPKMSDIKAKLKSSKTMTKEEDASIIGKIDASSFLHNNEDSLSKINKITPEVAGDITSRRKSLFESMDATDTDWEKTIVKRKLIASPQEEEGPLVVKKIGTQDWKYKQKSLAELQAFINKNKDIAPQELIRANSNITQTREELDSSQILRKSNQMKNQIVDKDKEFDDFLSELDDFMAGTSKTREEEDIKYGIKGYLDLIEPGPKKNDPSLPEIGSARKIKDIKSKLSAPDESNNNKKDNSKLIGKVSHFFKKSTNEKCDSAVIKENIATLLQPGKAKILSKSFESKPKLTRSSSVAEIPRPKLTKNMSFQPFQKEEKNKLEPLPKSKKTYVNTSLKSESKVEPPKLLEKKSSYVPKKYKSEWEDITDPEEKRNAILAKHGLKPMKKERDDDDSDIEDILNYENKEEMSQYEKDLKQRYLLLDSDASSKESSPEPEKNKKGSFSSLLNILTMMKKTTTNKNFADSKAKAMEFGKERGGRLSRSEIDLSEISGSCTDVKKLFESGKAFDASDRRRSIGIEDEDMKSVNAAEKRAHWEEFFNKPSSKQFKSSKEEVSRSESVTNIKELFEQGKLSQEAIRKYIDQRSETSSTEDKNKMYSKVKYMFESGNVPKNRDSDESDDEDRGQSVQSELEELRQAAKLKSRFQIEKGRTNIQSNGQETNLRRANSCIGVSGERLPDDLDEETMMEVSVANKMVKAMFEQNAPKYKFGGSGSNLSLNSSKENVNKKGPVMKPSVKPKEERKWVLDSINKYFEVIVEEEEEENSDEENSDDNSIYSESEYESDDDDCDASEMDEEEEEEEQSVITNNQTKDFHSTSKMRGLLSSVVSNISGSVGNLASKEIIHNLKQNLGSQINLRTSNSNISKV